MGSFADIEARGINALALQFFHLINERFWINYNSVTDGTGCVGEEDAGWDESKCKFTLLMHNSVPCIAPTLVAYDKVGMHRQLIYNLPFTFVAPLCADNCNYHHSNFPSPD